MNQESDSRDDQEHDHGEGIQQEAALGGEGPRLNPGEETVDDLLLLCRQPDELGEDGQQKQEAGTGGRAAEAGDDASRQPLPHQAVEQEAGEGWDQGQPEILDHGQP